MILAITTGLIVLVVFVAFAFIARRVFRLALKLALAGAVIAVLFVGASVAWWRGWFSSSSRNERPIPQSNQRSNSNRRPSR
jgi:membrane protein implicated in regulation of membrane protease activity